MKKGAFVKQSTPGILVYATKSNYSNKVDFIPTTYRYMTYQKKREQSLVPDQLSTFIRVIKFKTTHSHNLLYVHIIILILCLKICVQVCIVYFYLFVQTKVYDGTRLYSFKKLTLPLFCIFYSNIVLSNRFLL